MLLLYALNCPRLALSCAANPSSTLPLAVVWVTASAALLVGLGFNPLYAAGLCLIANTAPVAFGALGIPIIVAGQCSSRCSTG